MNLIIVADSSSDLFQLEGVPYAHVPLKIISAQREYVDEPGLDVYDMLEGLHQSKAPSSTSCPNAFEWKEAFGGADGVFAVTITSNLSGSCAAARAAAEDYREEHPEARVSVLDSLSTGPEMVLIIEKLRDLILSGKDFDTVDGEIRAYMQRTHLLFSLQSLDNLARNGRVSPAVAKLAGMLGIRMVGRASSEGTLEPLHKCRGEKKTLATLFEEMKATGYCGGKVRIDHCLNLRAAVELKELIVKEFAGAAVTVGTCMGLCSYYAEQGGLLVGYESA